MNPAAPAPEPVASLGRGARWARLEAAVQGPRGQLAAGLVVGLIGLGLSLQAAVRPILDLDVWWVATAGREILQSGRVPTTNAFSFAAPDYPWVMHEWLLGPAFALGLQRVGAGFFALLAVLACGGATAMLLRATLSGRRHLVAGLLLLGVALLFATRFVHARPTTYALLFPMGMVLLAFGPRFGRAHLAGAVALEALWANCHGSFPLGLALLGAGALDRREGRRLELGAAALASLATLANPYGLRLHGLVDQYLRGDGGGTLSLIHERVEEFAPLWDALREGTTTVDLGPVKLAGLALCALLAVSSLRGRWRLRGLVALGLLALGIQHVRHLDYFGLLAPMLLAPHLDDLLDRSWAAPPAVSRRRLVGLALAPLALSLLAWGGRQAARSPAGWIDGSLGGAAVMELAGRLPQGARVFTSWETAGFVTWLAYPRARIFIDSRNDCYPPEIFAAGFELDERPAEPDAPVAKLAAYGADHALVAASHPVSGAAARSADWTLVHAIGDWNLYARRRETGAASREEH